MPPISPRTALAVLFTVGLLAITSAVYAAPKQAADPAAPQTSSDLLAAHAAPLVAPPAAAAERTGCAQLWIHPVTAPIIDGYRPPSSTYGPGNRGLEYGTVLGDPVRAVADGTVDFSGQVGGSRFVVLNHPSGLRSTYGFLDRTLVSFGDFVGRGQQVAEAGPGFHLTARLAGRYRDPTPLLEETCYRSRLVPIPDGAGRT